MTLAESVLAQYEKNKAAVSGNRVSQEERMKKYFTTVLPKGTSTAEKRIRILPTKDGSSPFVEVFFHEMQVDGKWVKLFDPEQEGKRSPLNEIRQQLLLTGIDTDKELAKTYRSRKFYIVKLIDRDNEQDGVKFWRFKDAYKGDGVLDKLVPIIRKYGEIADPETGRDLTITLALAKSNNGKDYTFVSSVLPDDKSKLHEDPAISAEWVNDELVWSDVYFKKGEDYLDMVASGDTPKWDNNLSKWIRSNEATGEATIGSKVEDPQAQDEPDEELPF